MERTEAVNPRSIVTNNGIKYDLVQKGWNSSGEIQYSYKARYKFDGFIGWGGTIKISVVKEIDGISVEDISELFFDVELNCGKSNKHDNIVTTFDMSGSDLSSVIVADGLFSPLYNYTVIRAIMPDDPGRRLAPFKAKRMFYARFNNIQEIIDHVDFSRIINASELFAYSDIEEFDFSRNRIKTSGSKGSNFKSMFEGCSDLKIVKGCINNKEYGREYIDVTTMFLRCESLEVVEDSVFSDTVFTDSNQMFSYCRKLVKCGLSGNNFELYGKKSRLLNIFSACDSLDINDIGGLLTYLSHKTTLIRPFSGCSVDKAHGAKLRVFSSRGLFGEIKSSVIDLSGIEIAEGSKIGGVLDFFLCPSFDYENSMYSMSVDNIYRHTSGRLPKIIVVNKYMPISDKDRKIFDIVSMEDVDDEVLDVKIKTMVMFDVHNMIIIRG